MEQNTNTFGTYGDMGKIMSKIKKLKAMYEGAKKIGSEAEAATAAALLNKLLLQYNLSMEEIDLSDKPQDPIGHEVISGFEYTSIGGEWENRLTLVLCKHNLCHCYVYGKSYKRLLIVGRQENKELVKWMLAMLKERYVSFSKDAYKAYKESDEYRYTRYSKDRFQRSYLLGCAEGLDAKLTEERKREEKADARFATQINALVVQSDGALKAYVAEQFGKTGHRACGRTNAPSARAQGYAEGKRTELYKPISASTHKQASAIGLLGK